MTFDEQEDIIKLFSGDVFFSEGESSLKLIFVSSWNLYFKITFARLSFFAAIFERSVTLCFIIFRVVDYNLS